MKIVFLDQSVVILYSPAEFPPSEDVDAEQALCSVTLGDGIGMGLKRGVVGSRCHDRELAERRRKIECGGDLLVDFAGRQLCGRPLTLALALHARNRAVGGPPADIDPILALALAAIANGILVVPGQREEIRANVLELIPVTGRGQLYRGKSRHSRPC
jgi:hypothetical protein